MENKNDITLDFLLDDYLKYHTLRPSSIKNYRNCLERFARENEITLLSEISEELLVTWKKEVLMRATATTWNNYHTHLRALLNFAVRKNWIDENYLLNIPKARKPKLKKKNDRIGSIGKNISYAR